MMWIYLAIGAGVVVGVWILSRRPVKREVTTGDFRHFFQEMLKKLVDMFQFSWRNFIFPKKKF